MLRSVEFENHPDGGDAVVAGPEHGSGFLTVLAGRIAGIPLGHPLPFTLRGEEPHGFSCEQRKLEVS